MIVTRVEHRVMVFPRANLLTRASLAVGNPNLTVELPVYAVYAVRTFLRFQVWCILVLSRACICVFVLLRLLRLLLPIRLGPNGIMDRVSGVN